MPKAISLEELAERWGVDVPDVEAELASGRLSSFLVNGKRRISATAIDEFERQEGTGPPLPAPVATAQPFTAATPFTHVWPNRMEEHYTEAFAARLDHHDGPRHVRIGFGDRRTVGRLRRRAVMFLSDRPFRDQERAIGGRPVAEFVGVDDYERSRLLASLVKTSEGKEVRARAELPGDYADVEVVPYNSVITGPYSHGGLAVLVRDDDLAGMIRHGLIRARAMGLV